MDTYVFSSFVNQLKAFGYPENSLTVNYKDGRLKMDNLKVHVIDPLTRYKLCAFEFQDSGSASKPLKAAALQAESPVPPFKAGTAPTLPAESKAPPAKTVTAPDKRKPFFHSFFKDSHTRRVRRTTTALLTYNVRVDGVEPADPAQLRFRLQLDKDPEPEISISQLPPIYVLTNASRGAELWDRNNDTEQKIDWFKRLCYLLAFALVALCVINLAGWHVFTEREFAFITAAVVLMILPRTKVIKMFGMEIERSSEAEEKANTVKDLANAVQSLTTLTRQSSAAISSAASNDSAPEK